MAHVDEAKGEINVKVAFLGANVSGLHDTFPADEVSDLITVGGLHFFTLRRANTFANGMRLVLHVFGGEATDDARVMHNLLLGAEALVLVISAKSTRLAAASHLRERVGSLPFVVQLVDADHADAITVPELRAALSLHDVPVLGSISAAFEAVVSELAKP